MSPDPSTAPAASKRAAALPPAERRAAIIEAVRPLLLEYGESVTIRQIACAAGIAEGTIFRVFADKDELLDAALEAALDHTALENSLGAIDPQLRFEQKLTLATEIMQRRVVDVWSLLSRIGPRRDQEKRPVVESPALAAIFAAHPDSIRVAPADAAHALRSLTLALTHPMMSAEPATADDIVDVILHGIGTGTPE
ncbi:MAG: helix-turn-helix domain-containing protein [Ilumatobacteraceae bacterium]